MADKGQVLIFLQQKYRRAYKKNERHSGRVEFCRKKNDRAV